MENISEKKVYKFIAFVVLLNLIVAMIINSLFLYMDWLQKMNSHLQLAVKIVCQVVPVMYFLRKNKIPMTKLTTRRFEAKAFVLPLFMIILIFFINTGISSLLETKIGSPTFTSTTSLRISTIILLIIVSPIIEEILFRGILFQSQEAQSITKLVSVNALAFSLFHFNLYQLVPTFILGVFLTYVIFIYKNLYLVILLHMIYNSLIMMFSLKTNIMYQLFIITKYGLFAFLLSLVTFIVLFIRLIIKNRKKVAI